MNEHDLAKKIVRELNRETEQLDPHTTTRLKSARDAAMSHYRTLQSAHNLTLAGNGSTFTHTRNWISQHRLWLPIAALVIGLVAIAYWQDTMQNDDLEDVDASLLSSDLPVNAYVDHRLSTWLESSKQ